MAGREGRYSGQRRLMQEMQMAAMAGPYRMHPMMAGGGRRRPPQAGDIPDPYDVGDPYGYGDIPDPYDMPGRDGGHYFTAPAHWIPPPMDPRGEL